MSYIVVYQRGDGSSGLEECTDFELAVVAAERLRNVDDVESPRIFKTEEIHFDFRPYYRVEVSKEADPVASALLDPWAEAEADVETRAAPGSTEIVAEDPTPEPVDEPDSRGSFSGEHIPDPPQEFPAVTHLTEDVSDVVPPRRGLFGR